VLGAVLAATCLLAFVLRVALSCYMGRKRRRRESVFDSMESSVSEGPEGKKKGRQEEGESILRA
jgi:hypothetical protein